MRLRLLLCLLLVACPKPPKEPTPEAGPFMVLFTPWVTAKDTKAPTETAKKIFEIQQEVFPGKQVMDDETARALAKQEEPCKDLPCAAEVARTVNTTWFLTAQLMAFPPEHCFIFFSARSFETGAEVLGYNKEEVEKSSVTLNKANFSLKSEKLKKCNDAAFYEQVRQTLQTMSEDPGLKLLPK
jgi:hypothetical protein